MINENNRVTISGTVSSIPVFVNEFLGEKFYSFMVEIKRISGTSDQLPVTVSDRMIDVMKDYCGRHVHVRGEFRSHNLHRGEKSHLVLSVFAQELMFNDETEDNINQIALKGFICKPPVYRETPLGREITDLLVAVNRPYDKSDYIPCIAWGRNARTASLMDVGARVELTGRIQSREYQKLLEDGKFDKRTTYEMSVSIVKEIK